jgi:hypothetical protein
MSKDMNALVGKRITLADRQVRITGVDDFIAREPAVGIRHDYAVVQASDGKEYVCFDTGEVQCDDVVVGTVPWPWEPF